MAWFYTRWVIKVRAEPELKESVHTHTHTHTHAKRPARDVFRVLLKKTTLLQQNNDIVNSRRS